LIGGIADVQDLPVEIVPLVPDDGEESVDAVVDGSEASSLPASDRKSVV
jgi:hypothetical protein